MRVLISIKSRGGAGGERVGHAVGRVRGEGERSLAELAVRAVDRVARDQSLDSGANLGLIGFQFSSTVHF